MHTAQTSMSRTTDTSTESAGTVHSTTTATTTTATTRGTTGTHSPPGTTAATAPAASGGDPRVGWSSVPADAPILLHRRDGILPTVAAALSVRGTTLTATPKRGEDPPDLHPLVQDFLDALPSAQRERFTGRCAEAQLLSRHLTTADAGRSKRARRKPMTNGEARKALKHAKLTTRRIREDGDPLHGAFARPCRSCTALTDHFGVRVVDPTAADG
ncbi:YwqJ-related putative deaminase [Streptomyces sp. NRRL B-1347]|uniref:YwqJ-related putative deaminase n=1 Tax=Streptomyces sp. NRRL B-1347 TaxID=1476877 RepID=UPI000AC1DD27|nr:YwqJ-related putative deaminase [Streptomyces sp. NRRL B-1347]